MRAGLARRHNSCSRWELVSVIPARSTRSPKRAGRRVAEPAEAGEAAAGAVGMMVAQIGTRRESLRWDRPASSSRAATTNRWCASAAISSTGVTLERASAADVPLADFGRVFGSGGVFDKFFHDNLAALVDVSREPWRWREGAASIGGSAAMLRQFQHAQRIRDVYFKPARRYPKRASSSRRTCSTRVTRFTLDVDGQAFEYRHGPREQGDDVAGRVGPRGRVRGARRRRSQHRSRVHGPGSGCSIRRASSARAKAACALPSPPEGAACVWFWMRPPAATRSAR